MKLTVEDLRRIRKNENDRRRRANKAFKAADKAGKRVLIAKDVLKQIAEKRITPKQLVYLRSTPINQLINAACPSGWDEEEDKLANELGKTQLCDAFSDMKSCQACALGSVFVSGVMFMDKLKAGDVAKKWGEIDNQELMQDYMSKVFSTKQLYMIENAFEGTSVNTLYRDGHKPSCLCTTKEGYYDTYKTCEQYDGALQDRCIAFNKGVTSARKRLERIMLNVIENNGTFVP